MTSEALPDPLTRWLTPERKRAYDELFGGAQEVLGISDRERRIRYLSQLGPGYSLQDVLGKDICDLLPNEFRQTVERAHQALYACGSPQRYDFIYHHGGHPQLWEVNLSPLRVDDQVVGGISVSRDVTDMRLEQNLRDRFFSLSLDRLLVIDSAGRLKRANPAFCLALGYPDTDLVGRALADFVHSEDQRATAVAVEQLSLETPETEFETRLIKRDGDHLVFAWRGKLDPLTRDRYVVARDITVQRATEHQLRQAQKMEAVGQLAGGIAHDFNNLMQAVLANAELALGDLTPGTDLAEPLQEIEAAGRRAAELTKQLLAFSRHQTLRLKPLDLNEVLQGLMKMLRRLLPESIAIDLIPGHNLASANADRGQLEQVLVNLCVNARDAIEGAGQLTIETENVLVNGRYRESHPWARPGRYVLLSLTDTGVGMTKEQQERIFEPFYSTKAVNRGTGLGLSTVYGIVRQHGGMVHVYSEPGHGTTFKVYLPADSRQADVVGTKIAPRPKRGRETILVAEDEDQVRRVVVRVLQRNGYEVVEARDGSEAVRVLREREQPVDIALLDVVMPELCGPEAWEEMRQVQPSLKVVFASGYADNKNLAKISEQTPMLEKPFRSEELLARIREVLDAPSADE